MDKTRGWVSLIASRSRWPGVVGARLDGPTSGLRRVFPSLGGLEGKSRSGEEVKHEPRWRVVLPILLLRGGVDTVRFGDDRACIAYWSMLGEVSRMIDVKLVRPDETRLVAENGDGSFSGTKSSASARRGDEVDIRR